MESLACLSGSRAAGLAGLDFGALGESRAFR